MQTKKNGNMVTVTVYTEHGKKRQVRLTPERQCWLGQRYRAGGMPEVWRALALIAGATLAAEQPAAERLEQLARFWADMP